ncbi:hypothetical protein D3C73_1456280 [compost metagenome]
MQWIANKEEYVLSLTKQMEAENKRSEDKEQAEYYKSKYRFTKEKVEKLCHEISDCKRALKIIHGSNQLKEDIAELLLEALPDTRVILNHILHSLREEAQ